MTSNHQASSSSSASPSTAPTPSRKNSAMTPADLSPALSRYESEGDKTLAITNTQTTAENAVNTSSSPSRRGSGSSGSSYDDRIHGWADIKAALKLTWKRQEKHLLITWLHVPIGVTFLLVISWGLRLAIQQAPFRFPAPVIAMMVFFFGLLILEWLSIRFPGKPKEESKDQDVEQGRPVVKDAPRKRKRFVDPVMALLAPPCEFLLRNMSVMFTPSFILIPAREVIDGKEIGLLAAWFTASQIIAFVLPVWFNLSISKVYSSYQSRYSKQARMSARDKRERRHSATASAIHSRRGSLATLSGVDYEKGVGFGGGAKLGPVATGLSGLTAHIIAPVTHVRVELDEDFRRHIESTALEAARQQGDPAVNDHLHRLKFDSYRPVSDVSNFKHQHSYHGRPTSAGRGSSRIGHLGRSRERSSSARRHAKGSSVDATVRKRDQIPRLSSHTRSASSADEKLTRLAVDDDAAAKADSSNDTQMRESRSQEIRPLNMPTVLPAAAAPDMSTYRFPSAPIGTQPGETLSVPILQMQGQQNEPMLPRSALRQSHLPDDDNNPDLQTAVQSRRPSEINWDGSDEKRKIEFMLTPHPSGRNGPQSPRSPTETDDSRSSQSQQEQDSDDDEEVRETAVERLASWFGDLITPAMYFVLFIVGIPLFFVKDIALPLFLAINILTFIAAITIVPPKIRRFLHPILSTSLATVLIIWAFAAMKGIGLKNCLNRFYSVDARYSVLWDPNGYTGPVPGAGDILFSTLDAGIVALAVPMYRYRKELWQNLTRMLIVLVPCAALSLFVWNWIAHLMGMDATRSLAFSARFMSTPLAIELAGNIGADESITVILVVITGVVAAIFKEQFFYKLMRVSKDDYLTVGLTMGATSGAIGASSLLSTPRTMAIASLGFVVFGTILLIATAIPSIVDIVQSLSGM